MRQNPPESHVGGPLALLRTGDIVELGVLAWNIAMRVLEEELAWSHAARTPPPARFSRGYGCMFSCRVRQAHEGCDFDFLKAGFGPTAGEPAIH